MAAPNYKNMEEVVKEINRSFVSLNGEDMTKNSKIITDSVNTLITYMKEIDSLFSIIYERIFFGGSYYDNLKIEEPNEFDIDLVLCLPKSCETCKKKDCGCIELTPSNIPGSFWFKMKNGYFKLFDRFIVNNYVQTNLVLDWLKSLLTKALNKVLITNSKSIRYGSESGPALTLSIPGHNGKSIDVDMVPSFKFGETHWPKQGFIKNPTNLWEFFVVPKAILDNKCWRASFQIQERQLISSKTRLKPALRLLKKMKKNINHHDIKSYHLKTIVLNNLNTIDWNLTLSEIFMKLLHLYRDCIFAKKIPYYWNNKYNLIANETKPKIASYQSLDDIIRKINEQCNTNPKNIALYIISPQEYKMLFPMPGHIEIDNILKLVYEKYCSIIEGERKTNEDVVRSTLDQLFSTMCSVRMCSKFEDFYDTDSYYIDIENAFKFNIFLPLKLPSTVPLNRTCQGVPCEMNITFINSNKPGTFLIKAPPNVDLQTLPFCDPRGYIETNRVVVWLQKIVTLAHNKLHVDYSVSTCTSSIVLNLTVEKPLIINIIPSIVLREWPTQGYKPNPTQIEDLYLIPNPDEENQYWTVSFIKQEQHLLDGVPKLKQALSLLEKMKTTMQHNNISGYCLKTIALNSAISVNTSQSLSEIFMYLLNKYGDCLAQKKIISYWNKKNNLLKMPKEETFYNYQQRLVRIMNKLNESLHSDPSVIASVILNPNEFAKLNDTQVAAKVTSDLERL